MDGSFSLSAIIHTFQASAASLQLSEMKCLIDKRSTVQSDVKDGFTGSVNSMRVRFLSMKNLVGNFKATV